MGAVQRQTGENLRSPSNFRRLKTFIQVDIALACAGIVSPKTKRRQM